MTETTRDRSPRLMAETGLSRDGRLTELRRRFAAEYLATNGNGAEAARRAGSTAKNARSAGQTLLTYSDVQAEIARLSAPVIAEQEITAHRVLRELALVAFGTLDEVAPWDEQGAHLIPSADLPRDKRALVASIKVKREREVRGRGEDAEAWDVEYVEIKPWDKMKALEVLARYTRIIEGDQVATMTDNRIQIAVGSLTDEQLAAILAVGELQTERNN